jgi:hypothetical protein
VNYLGKPVIGNFRKPPNPNGEKKERARDKRPGMDPQHLKNVAKLSSVLSGRTPCDAHHLRIKKERGIGLKATDQWAIPLTRDEHEACHKVGGRREQEWFEKRGVDCYAVARALWANKGDVARMQKIIDANIPPRRAE